MSVKQKLWGCGQFIAETPDGIVWEFQGAFENRDASIKACKDYQWFIFSFNLGEELPEQSLDMPGFEYPLA